MFQLDPALSVRFLGVRGSIPSPGPLTTAGGNTACVEVTAGDTRIILDAGSGLRTLGDERMRHGPRHSTILLSHLHWDHVCGLPFFTPIYVPGHRVEIASGPNGVMPMLEAIRALFKAPFFPVDFADIAGQVSVRELPAADRFTIGDITITLARLNHPDPVYGFRLDHGGHAIVYATDTEHFACVERSETGGGDPAGFAGGAGGEAPRGIDPTLKRLAAGADILIYDAQYTPDEYPSKVGWGHSTWQAGADLARAAGVPQLVLFHHDPGRTDAQLAAIEAEAQAHLPGTIAAREGLVLRACDAERAAAAA
jgi:phosphoribosyl 1,2-cyclic phosphodiesterase